MKKDSPHILLINPWIDDFAAYDFWAKPLGLLTIAGILRMHGYTITYIDCLDRFHPEELLPYIVHDSSCCGVLEFIVKLLHVDGCVVDERRDCIRI